MTGMEISLHNIQIAAQVGSKYYVIIKILDQDFAASITICFHDNKIKINQNRAVWYPYLPYLIIWLLSENIFWGNF